MKSYVAVIILTVFSIAVLITLVLKNNSISRHVKSGMTLSAALTVICAASECLGVLLNDASVSLRIPHLIVKFLELSVAPAIPIAFATSFYPIRKRRLYAIPLGIHTTIELLSIFFGITFTVGADNIYRHCRFYFLYHIAYFAATIFLIIRFSQFSSRFQKRNDLSLSMLLLFVLFGVLCQAIDGTIRIVWMTVAVGEILFYIFYCNLIGQIDALTELLNRRSFEISLGRLKKRVGILVLDVNRFKEINDTYGHPYGDRCLSEIGAALKAAYGRYGSCYRIGGDEFCVILERRIDAVNGLNLVFQGILSRKRLQEKQFPTVSFGYAIYEPGDRTISDIYSDADRQMYAKKDAVRD